MTLLLLVAFSLPPQAPPVDPAYSRKAPKPLKVFCPHGVDCECGASCMCGRSCTCAGGLMSNAKFIQQPTQAKALDAIGYPKDTSGVRTYDSAGRPTSTTMGGIRFQINEYGAIVSPPHPYQWEIGQFVGDVKGKPVTIQGPQQPVLQPVTYQQPQQVFYPQFSYGAVCVGSS